MCHLHAKHLTCAGRPSRLDRYSLFHIYSRSSSTHLGYSLTEDGVICSLPLEISDINGALLDSKCDEDWRKRGLHNP